MPFPYSDFWSSVIAQTPFSLNFALEALVVGIVIWFFARRAFRTSVKTERELTEQEKDEIIAAWEPEPLVPETQQDHPALHRPQVDGKMGKYLEIDHKQHLNLATMNFLGFIGDKRIEEPAKQAIFKYGVGSCGPRAFYGTVDVHLKLEEELAEFLGYEEAVLYSYGFSTIASAIPAYSKKGDVIFVDKGVNFAIQKGLLASRSRIEWFEHNDMDDLERLLEIQADLDRKNPRKAKITRRFLVVEGLYLNSATICPLPKLIELKWKYKVRIFIDESMSFGVLGATGKGIIEHFGCKFEDVDMMSASLENAVASCGGFCAGRSYVVDHQRLSGLGYCFSASLPPLLAVAASQSLRLMREEPERFQRLRSRSELFRQGLMDLCSGTQFRLEAVEGSPIFHLKWGPKLPKTDTDWGAYYRVETILDTVVEMMMERGVAITRARYLLNEEIFTPEPSIRLTVNSELTDSEIEETLEKFKKVFQEFASIEL